MIPDIVWRVLIIVLECAILVLLHRVERAFGAYTEAVLKTHEDGLHVAKRHTEAYQQVLKALDYLNRKGAA